MPALPTSKPRRGPGRPPAGQSGGGQEALLAAARDLMAEKGLPRLTVREVAERAGVKPALVHYYFGGKQGLMQAVVAQVAATLVEGLEEGLGQGRDFEERLRAAYRTNLELLGRDPYGPRLVVEQVMFGEDEVIDAFVDRFARRNYEAIQGLLEDGRRAGAIRDVEAMFLIPLLFGSSLFFFIAAPLIKRLSGVDEITPDLARRFADHTIDVVLRGIAADREGIE